MTKIIALTLIALSTAASSKPMSPIETVIRKTLAPYSDPNIVAPDYLHTAPWSAQIRALIKRWENTGKADEVTSLSGGDWLCQCQDWDNKMFRVTRVKTSRGKGGSFIADTQFMVSASEPRRLKYVMIWEDGAWHIDDLIFMGDAKTLKAQLRSEIKDAAK